MSAPSDPPESPLAVIAEQVRAAEAAAFERGREEASSAQVSRAMQAVMVRAFASAMASTAQAFDGTEGAAVLERLVRRARREAEALLSESPPPVEPPPVEPSVEPGS